MKYVHRIERHDIDSRCSMTPLNTPTDPKYAEFYKDWDPAEHTEKRDANGKLVGWETSVRQELRIAERRNRSWFGRMDILLGSVPDECCPTCGHERDRQVAVFPGENGTLIGDVQHFSKEDLEWAEAESRKCWEVAQTEPLFMKVIGRKF